MPFVSYALISDKFSPAELRRLAEYQITPLLTGIPGVEARRRARRPDTRGPGHRRSRRSFSAYGLTLADVANAIAETNDVKAVGRIEDNDLLYLAVNNNAFDSVKSVAQRRPCAPEKAASCGSATSPRWRWARCRNGCWSNDNGQPAVTFDVFQQDSADSLSLARRGRHDGSRPS